MGDNDAAGMWRNLPGMSTGVASASGRRPLAFIIPGRKLIYVDLFDPPRKSDCGVALFIYSFINRCQI